MKLNYRSQIFLLLISLFWSCNSKGAKTESSKRFDAKIQLKLINNWKINSSAVVPNPRFAGVVLKDTSLILADVSLNTINRFNKKGYLIQSIGGTGRGPAEFLDVTHAAINPDGKVAVADIKNARFTIIYLFKDSLIIEPLDPGWHTRLHWVADELVLTNNPFKEGATNPGDIFMRLFNLETGEKKLFYQMKLELGDAAPVEQISCTFCEFHFTDDLTFFTSPEDTSYRIYRVNPKTNGTLLFTRSGVPAVEYTEQEIKQLKKGKQRAYQMAGKNYDGNDLPTHKPRFIDYFPDKSGRLWVLITPPAGQEPVFDIFSPDGKYIGSLQAPQDTKLVQFIRDNYILFIYKTEDTDIWEGSLYKILD